MDSVLYRLYGDERIAEGVKARLVAAGVKRRTIALLTLPSEQAAHVGSYVDSGAHAHDAERDHVGSFAPHQHADDMLRELAAAGLARGAAEDCVARMAQGAALLLVRPGAGQHARVSEMLEIDQGTA